MSVSSGLRQFFINVFWPIKNHELKKFIPMSLLMFAILFSQNILRILKDSIVISEISVEVTNFAKVYCVTPAAAIFVIIYSKMVNKYDYQKIFNYLMIFFTGFFVIFAFILYPNTEFFHPDSEYINILMNNNPNFKWYIALFGYWSYITFYVLAELWPNIFYILLFWQLANDITQTDEAKRFYTLFSLFGNSSLVVVGLLMIHLSKEDSFIQVYFSSIDSDLVLIQFATIILVLMALLSCYIVNFISKNIVGNPLLYFKKRINKIDKPKMSLRESFSYIVSSRYLWLLLICSAAFGLCMNLVEAVWKSKIKELYPNLNDFAAFNSLYILWTGVAIMIMTIIGNNIMRKYDWFVSAIITPMIILITGSIFFVLVIFDDIIFSFTDGLILVSPLVMAVWAGALQNILSKGTKYSIWDTSREMLYIPLDEELKTKGKAAVDIVSSKIGKSSSSLVQSLLFSIFPAATYSSISPYIMLFFVFICVLWINAVKEINDEYKRII